MIFSKSHNDELASPKNILWFGVLLFLVIIGGHILSTHISKNNSNPAELADIDAYFGPISSFDRTTLVSLPKSERSKFLNSAKNAGCGKEGIKCKLSVSVLNNPYYTVTFD